VLADQIANLTKKSHNVLQLQATISFKMNHVWFGWYNKWHAEVQNHV